MKFLYQTLQKALVVIFHMRISLEINSKLLFKISKKFWRKKNGLIMIWIDISIDTVILDLFKNKNLFNYYKLLLMMKP